MNGEDDTNRPSLCLWYVGQMRLLGVVLFGIMALAFTVLAFWFPFAIFLYGPVCLVVWFLFFVSIIHALRPRP